MKIASWNVNSLNVRLPHLTQWLGTFAPDIVGLQETKLEDHRFPDTALAELGYRSVFAGQKTNRNEPNPADVAGFNAFMERYTNGLEIERAAVKHLK